MFSRRNIRARLDCERFKSITKLRGWFFTRCRTVTPLANFHAAINRNQAGIGVEAEGEKEANQEERQKFLEGSHSNLYYSLESPSKQETVLLEARSKMARRIGCELFKLSFLRSLMTATACCIYDFLPCHVSFVGLIGF